MDRRERSRPWEDKKAGVSDVDAGKETDRYIGNNIKDHHNTIIDSYLSTTKDVIIQS